MPNPLTICISCGASEAGCLVPNADDGADFMCWRCVHAHVDHGCAAGIECITLECDCTDDLAKI